MGAMATRPVLRWLLPAGLAVAVIGGGAATTAISASADASLPGRSAAQLLVDLQTARLNGLSGTVVERADLGLPSLPAGLVGGQGSSQLNSLITGSHTLRVWYSGPDKARVALLGTLGESDIITNGTDLWTWSSDGNTATHSALPRDRKLPGDRGGNAPLISPSAMPTTPQQAADRALAAIGPTTAVATNGNAVVAGRPAYELVLTPKDTASKIVSVHIAIDGRQHVPLRVQVFARGSTSPAVEIGFTQVSFSRPDAAQFRFNPPPGVQVTERAGRNATDGQPPGDAAKAPEPVVLGKGWTSVLAARLDIATLLGQRPATGDSGAGTPRHGDRAGAEGLAGTYGLMAAMPRVSGAWGSGRLLTGRLFSVLLTDDGRVFAGAVSPERLYQAAADPATAGLKATR